MYSHQIVGHTTGMENVSRQHSDYSNRMPVLVTGILMTIASVILFAVGYATDARAGLWIASVVVGVVSSIILMAATYLSGGLYRVMGMVFLTVQVVFITIIATLYFGGMSSTGIEGVMKA